MLAVAGRRYAIIGEEVVDGSRRLHRAGHPAGRLLRDLPRASERSPCALLLPSPAPSFPRARAGERGPGHLETSSPSARPSSRTRSCGKASAFPRRTILLRSWWVQSRRSLKKERRREYFRLQAMSNTVTHENGQADTAQQGGPLFPAQGRPSYDRSPATAATGRSVPGEVIFPRGQPPRRAVPDQGWHASSSAASRREEDRTSRGSWPGRSSGRWISWIPRPAAPPRSPKGRRRSSSSPTRCPSRSCWTGTPYVFARILRKLLGRDRRQDPRHRQARLGEDPLDRGAEEAAPPRQAQRAVQPGLPRGGAAAHPAAQPAPTSLLVVKPDNFKTINDTCGHEAGDKTLVLLAEALKSCLGRGRHRRALPRGRVLRRPPGARGRRSAARRGVPAAGDVAPRYRAASRAGAVTALTGERRRVHLPGVGGGRQDPRLGLLREDVEGARTTAETASWANRSRGSG